MTARTISAAALLGLLAACAGAEKRPPASPARAAAAPSKAKSAAPAPAAAGQKPTPAADAAPGLSPRAQRLFDDAIRAEEEQKKLKVPTDWAYLERKWRAVLEESDVAEARYNLGVTLEAQGRLSDARAEYQRARQLKPTLRQAAANLGVLVEKQGDTNGAAALYAQNARDFPEDSVSRERLAALYRASGQTEEAWRLAREALVREPRSLAAYKVLARVALQRNELDLAQLIALRAQKFEPNDPELPFFAGEVRARQGDDAAAAVQFNKALALQPGFLPARYALLDAALKRHAWGPVAEQSAAILKQQPKNAALHLTLGVAQRHLGKTDEALASFAQAEKLGEGKLPEVHLARGVLFARVKSECEPALEEIRKYQRAAAPGLADGAQVSKLQRDCEQMLEENRKALEAAKQMQADAAKQAAEEAAKKAAEEAAKKAAEAAKKGGDAGKKTGEQSPKETAEQGTKDVRPASDGGGAPTSAPKASR